MKIVQLTKNINIRRIRRRGLFFLFAALFLATALPSISNKAYASQNNSNELFTNDAPIGSQFSNVTAQFNVSEVEKIVNDISSFGSRVTGYEGYYKTRDFIVSYLNGIYGYNSTEIQNYSLLVPIQEEATINVISPFNKTIKAYTLWPNGIQTCNLPENGTLGKIVYVGDGKIENFEGKNISGAFVLMDYNSMYNWINAAKFGAKGVIFIQPNETTYLETDSKYLSTPLYFPRLIVQAKDGEILKEANEIVVKSRMSYKEVTAQNIILKINGTTYPNDIIIISAHYDAWAIAPALANSKADAIGIALLLELAKYFKNNPPKYSIWLVATSGHWEALAGAREFTYRYIYSNDIMNGKKTIWSFVGLDMFSSDSYGLQMLQSSFFNFYGGASIHSGGFPTRLTPVYNRLLVYLNSSELRQFLINEKRIGQGSTIANNFFLFYTSYQQFWGTEPYPYMLDSEVVSMSGIIAFSITSAWSSRNYVGAPIDDSEYANLKKISPELTTLFFIISQLANDDQLRNTVTDRSTLRPTWFSTESIRGYPGFITINGKVVIYNETNGGWFSPIKDVLVTARVAPSTYKLGTIIVKSGENGTFVIHGIAQAARPYGANTATITYPWILQGWKTDPETGQIVIAPNNGMLAMQYFSSTLMPIHPVENFTIVVMKANTTTLYDIVDPRTLATPSIQDPRLGGYNWWGFSMAAILPFDAQTKSLPPNYGSYYNGYEPVGLVWTSPGIKFVVVVVTQGTNGLILTNSSSANPEGIGFSSDKNNYIYFTLYKSAQDLFYISKDRYEKFKEKETGTISADITIKEAEILYNKTTKLFSENKLYSGYSATIPFFTFAYTAYSREVMPLINDAAKSIMIMFPLLILGAFFLEKLTLHQEGRKRVISIGLFAAILIAFLSFLHPAFSIMSNVYLGLLGTAMTFLLLLTIWVIGGEAEKVRKSIEHRYLGYHTTESVVFDTVTTASSFSVEEMRKRPFRTILTVVTIAVMAFSLTSLTSVSAYTSVRLVPKYGYTTSYDGVLVKNGIGIPPAIVSDYLLDAIKYYAGKNATVLPRAWYYPQSKLTIGFQTPIYSSTNNASISAALGLTKDDVYINILPYVNNFDSSLLNNTENWALISNGLANNLSVKVGDNINVFGLKLKVAGIYNASRLDNLKDIDGYPIAPVNGIYYGQLAVFPVSSQAAQGSVPHLSMAQVLVIPFSKAMELGGYIAEVSIIPKQKSEDIASMFTPIAYTTNSIVYVSQNGKPYQMSQVVAYSFVGMETVQILALLGALNVMITLLGNLKERSKEIYVLSAVGLSPLATSVLFVVETVVYAIVGGLIGYLAGFAANTLMVYLNVFPKELGYVNFASIFTMVALVVIILTSLLASAYPSYIASRVITPSLERKWKPPTKPSKDNWEVPMPVSFITYEEALGILEYLREFYEGAGAVRP
ncbi:MAG: FtsX-like permease family protein, partial [Thermoproteota archaeon]